MYMLIQFAAIFLNNMNIILLSIFYYNKFQGAFLQNFLYLMVFQLHFFV